MIEETFPLNDPASYIRVQTGFYKRCRKPAINGSYSEFWMPWSAEMLKLDLTRAEINTIRKFDGFCCLPDHLNYQETAGSFYNLYQPLEWKPKAGRYNRILQFLSHIFGDQIDLGLDYLTLLYTKPTQKLPVLCLVSKERKTGKTTFLNLLKLIFGRNMTFNTNSDFRSQFNADWMNMLLIAVDEVLLDRKEDSEKIKNLSTAINSKVEAKGKDRKETEFFAKFILCSNNEESFIAIDRDEIRYWILKITMLKMENIHLLKEMREEIPAFLQYLLNRPLSVPEGLSRMWFSEKQIRTKALDRVIGSSRNKIEIELLYLFMEIFETTGDARLFFTNKDLLNLLKANIRNINRADLSKVLHKDLKLQPASNSLTYKSWIYSSSGDLVSINSTGRYYTISAEWLREIFDENA